MQVPSPTACNCQLCSRKSLPVHYRTTSSLTEKLEAKSAVQWPCKWLAGCRSDMKVRRITPLLQRSPRPKQHSFPEPSRCAFKTPDFTAAADSEAAVFRAQSCIEALPTSSPLLLGADVAWSVACHVVSEAYPAREDEAVCFVLKQRWCDVQYNILHTVHSLRCCLVLLEDVWVQRLLLVKAIPGRPCEAHELGTMPPSEQPQESSGPIPLQPHPSLWLYLLCPF